MTASQDHPTARDDLVVHEIDGELVVFDRATGGLHHLNATASAVFLSCDGEVSTEKLCREVADAFCVPVEDVTADVVPLLDRLRGAGLVT
jgi:PqqD family protein of HPr-rel-A system